MLARRGGRVELDPLGGTDLWTAALRIHDLDPGAFSYSFLPRATSAPVGTLAGSGRWRGPNVSGEPARATDLAGAIREVTLDSAALGESRSVRVYLPPDHDNRRRYPVVYGAFARAFPDIVEPLIVSGKLEPIICVGTFPRPGADGASRHGKESGRRIDEYLPGRAPERFAAHERFFVEEVPAEVESRFGASTQRRQRAVLGVSSGATFALAMGAAHPERFGIVIGFSPTSTPPLTTSWPQGAGPRHYLCAGTLEAQVARQTRSWAGMAEAAGTEVVRTEWVSGHDMVMWEGELPGALTWAFSVGTTKAPEPEP